MEILKYNNYKINYKIKNKAKSIINIKMKFRIKPILDYKQISNQTIILKQEKMID
jgi:hypothetical protein